MKTNLNLIKVRINNSAYNLTRTRTNNEEIQNVAVRCLVLSSHVKSASCMRELAASFLAPSAVSSLSAFSFSFLLSRTSSRPFHSSVAVLRELPHLFCTFYLFTYSSMYCNWIYICHIHTSNCAYIHTIIKRVSLSILQPYFYRFLYCVYSLSIHFYHIISSISICPVNLKK